MNREVVFSPEAQVDLTELYNFISNRSGAKTALAYTERLTSYCVGFAEFLERGTRRDDLWVGLRTIGFERRVTVAFHVTTDTVNIDRVLYGGQDLEMAFSGQR